MKSFQAELYGRPNREVYPKYAKAAFLHFWDKYARLNALQLALNVNRSLYSARVGESHFFAESVGYEELVDRIIELTVRAAVARSCDASDSEQDELRRGGLLAVQIFRGGKAIWADTGAFEGELVEARRERIEARFKRTNAADPELYGRLDRDLVARWRRAGYQTPSLVGDMKRLFLELERDAADRAEGAREALVGEILRETSSKAPSIA